MDFAFGVIERGLYGFVIATGLGIVTGISVPIGIGLAVAVAGYGLYQTATTLLDPKVPAKTKHRALGQLVGGIAGGKTGFNVGQVAGKWIGNKLFAS